MKIYKYKNYEQYVKSQVSAFNRKIKNQWACEENIKFLAEYLDRFYPRYGICHGVRQGKEIEWFEKYLPGCEVIGTDIGGALTEKIKKWDFNYKNPAWFSKFDFLYSNSFDHAFNPKNTLQIWADQVKSGGHLILEYDKRNEHTGEISKKVNPTDPVSITVNELVELIPQWIKVKSVAVVKMPKVKKVWQVAVICQV